MSFDIPDSELHWRFGPSGGPGGQHANKASTRVELTFDIEHSRVFDEPTRAKLMGAFGSVVRVTEDGSRSQAANRKTALAQLTAKLDDAARPDPPKRRTTQPSRAARRRRVDDKRARSKTKQQRQTPSIDD